MLRKKPTEFSENLKNVEPLRKCLYSCKQKARLRDHVIEYHISIRSVTDVSSMPLYSTVQ